MAPFTCVKTGRDALQASNQAGVSSHVFEGPHPAGLPGTHIHFIDPVKSVQNGLVYRLSRCHRPGTPVFAGRSAQ